MIRLTFLDRLRCCIKTRGNNCNINFDGKILDVHFWHQFLRLKFWGLWEAKCMMKILMKQVISGFICSASNESFALVVHEMVFKFLCFCVQSWWCRKLVLTILVSFDIFAKRKIDIFQIFLGNLFFVCSQLKGTNAYGPIQLKFVTTWWIGMI